MQYSGLVSVTFRKLSVDEIIACTKKAGLDGIEWGSDIHVPYGDFQKAKETAVKMNAAGLKTFSYGSYYRLGTVQNPVTEFEKGLCTALALEAPSIRLWAGTKNSEDTTAEERKKLVQEAQEIAERANKVGITLSFEYHGGTLTNTPESAVTFMQEIQRENVFLYWQPNQSQSFMQNQAALQMVMPYLSNLHVFCWDREKRYPLEKGYAEWCYYLSLLDCKNHGIFLEFVRDDSVSQLEYDARTLHNLLNEQQRKLPFSDDFSILKKPISIQGETMVLKNSLAIHPMEGFDGELNGAPSDLTIRRYDKFAKSGAGLLWLEATAVQEDARSCNRQLWIRESNLDDYKRLVERIHEKSGGVPIILQLTHSGRFSRPNNKLEPLITYHNPNFNLSPDFPTVTDDYLDRLEEQFQVAARLAQKAGLDGVDIKACHHYLLSELFSAYTREGKYGGSYENRTRLYKNIIRNIKREFGSNLVVASRLSIYDGMCYPYGFGTDKDDSNLPNLTEPLQLIGEIEQLGVHLLNMTMDGSDLHRMISYCGKVQKQYPDMTLIGTGYTGLHQFAPYVAAGAIEQGLISSVGFGRMALAYEGFAYDMINGTLDEKKICLTCGKCTEITQALGTLHCPVREGTA